MYIAGGITPTFLDRGPMQHRGRMQGPLLSMTYSLRDDCIPDTLAASARGGAPKTRWTGFAFTRYDSKGTGYLEEYIVC